MSRYSTRTSGPLNQTSVSPPRNHFSSNKYMDFPLPQVMSFQIVFGKSLFHFGKFTNPLHNSLPVYPTVNIWNESSPEPKLSWVQLGCNISSGYKRPFVGVWKGDHFELKSAMWGKQNCDATLHQRQFLVSSSVRGTVVCRKVCLVGCGFVWGCYSWTLRLPNRIEGGRRLGVGFWVIAVTSAEEGHWLWGGDAVVKESDDEGGSFLSFAIAIEISSQMGISDQMHVWSSSIDRSPSLQITIQLRLLLHNQINNVIHLHSALTATHGNPSRPSPNGLQWMSSRPNQYLQCLPTSNIANKRLTHDLHAKMVDLPMRNRALDRLSSTLSTKTKTSWGSIYILFFRQKGSCAEGLRGRESGSSIGEGFFTM